MKAYLQLIRLPAVFTSIADILLGFLLTHPTLEPSTSFAMLMIASTCLYMSGMVFNDIFDRAIDAEERPERPIPSRRISVMSATRLAILLIMAAFGAANVVGVNSVIIVVALIVCILAYDGFLKKTPLGCIAMGACRFLNVMLGASAVESIQAHWTLPQVHVAAAFGIYIAGVTWFARDEAKQSKRTQLIGAATVINLGLALLLAFFFNAEGNFGTTPTILLAVIGLTINRRLVVAISNPGPQSVQMAIRVLILSLITLDATVILFQTGNTTFAIITAALILPATTLGKWISVT